jgi:hypothetical protein
MHNKQELSGAAVGAQVDSMTAALGFGFGWSVPGMPVAGEPTAAAAELSQAAEELVPLSRHDIEVRALH